jgi:hypothetical protein
VAASPKRRSAIVVGVALALVVAAVVLAVSMRKHRTSPVPAGGYYTTSAPGTPLPSDATCAQRVHRATWEPRSDNEKQNHTKPDGPVHLAASDAFDSTWHDKYETRITGDFTGTTDEIIQWAACKWGIADNMVRAQAVVESHWHMDTESDKEPRSAGHCAPGDDRDPCPTSFGILQIKWYFHPSKNPVGNTYPMSKDMTAFSLDYALAELRGCYDGHAWVGKKATGDLMGCMGLWYSGEWRDDNALKYIGWVQRALDSKPWLYW